jgi:mannitol/fructose-specific phosphotransferase system IIA component (Ntr-type)
MDEKKYQSEDYIPLSGFKQGIKAFLRDFFRFLSFTEFVIIKRWYFIMIGLCFGILLGYIYYMSKPTFYKVSMVVKYSELTKKTYAEMLDQLNKLGSSGAGDRLSAILKIPHNIEGKVLYIESKNMNDDPLEYDTTTREQLFKIIVGLKDNSLSDTLQTAIVNYLNDNSYLKKLKEEQKKIYQEKLSFTDGELRKLDSLKLAYNKFLSTPNLSATFYNNAFNPADLYVQSAKLADQKETILRWLALDTSPILIIDGFKTTVSPQSISLQRALLILGSIGLLIGFLIGFMNEARKRISGTNHLKY